MAATPLLDRQFLAMRAKILELAADFDRLDRAGEISANDNRLAQLKAAVEILLDELPDRAGRVQQVFSRKYDPNWQQEFGWSTGQSSD